MAARVASEMIRDLHAPLSGTRNTCPKNRRPLMSTLLLDDKSYAAVNRFFQRRAMPRIWCCGGPATWVLPGLSASSVLVETRSAGGGDNPDACVSSGEGTGQSHERREPQSS